MIVEQLIDDADSPLLSSGLPACVGFRISMTAKPPNNSIGAQKRKRSLSFATRSNKLSDPRTIIPLTNTHLCGNRAAFFTTSSFSFTSLLLPVLDEPKTKLSQALYISVAVRKTMPPLQSHRSITGSPWCPVRLSSIATYIRFLRPPLFRLSPRMAAPTYGCYESALLGIAFLLQHRCSK